MSTETDTKVVAEVRENFGKGYARRLRAAGKIPAVIYGHGTDPVHVSLPGHQVSLLIRRANALASSEIVHGRLRLDMAGRRLSCDGQPVELSARELAVVELLLMREGRVVTKQQIIDHLYGWDDVSSVNAVEVFVYRLRRKCMDASGEALPLQAVRGVGYLFEP